MRRTYRSRPAGHLIVRFQGGICEAHLWLGWKRYRVWIRKPAKGVIFIDHRHVDVEHTIFEVVARL